jgi:hypothetical protein
VASAYAELIDGIVADEAVNGVPALVTDTLLDSAEDRGRLAREVIEFAISLSG